MQTVHDSQCQAIKHAYMRIGNDITELKTFCRTLNNWLGYFLNHCNYPILNGPIEGNNYKVKNIELRAYGYRNNYIIFDVEFYFLEN